MTASTGRVWYSGALDESKAARSRFGQAIFEFSAEARCTQLYGCFSVRLRPDQYDGFVASCGRMPTPLRYSSPTYFDNGTILPVYSVPEDEIAERPSASYVSFLARQARDEEREQARIERAKSRHR